MSGLNFGTPTTSAPTFSLGSNVAPGTTTGFNFGAQTSTTPAVQFNAPVSTSGVPLSTPGGSGFTFGSSGGLSMGTPATTQAPLSFKPGALGSGLSFGSPAATQQPSLSFGTPAASTAAPGTLFGSVPPANQQSLTFGSAPTTSQPLSFGTTPTTSQPLSFGSALGSTQLSFGNTPTTTQPSMSFGSNPTTSQSLNFGSTLSTAQPILSFGSTPQTTQAGLSFGSTPQTTQAGLSFGSTPQTTQAGLSFGSTPLTTQPTLNFGLSSSTTTTSAGFTLGTPVSTATGLSFGLGSQVATTKPTLSFGTATTTAVSTPASSLLNFSAPKTTATTGFSLSVPGGTGTGSLFAPPTSSAPTTSAPVVFKGLGGVDTSTTQGSGQKDAKSVKENLVNQEIMQTLDTFKSFVKQQKNLSCEVSRAPVKPMHKVTDDTDALKKLLISVSSTLQRNRGVANKLKVNTTKCLSLCEMAQRTQDTPLGLQNDNVAPLEFFIQLVSKFERDILVLRQEIDNTEKHVNSLSYPAILTPQELSVALRRLHDSFVALAGRLQTAHAGVIAQKERHLSLRRHFLKDHTNIFEGSSRTTSQTKKPQCNFILLPGPTPFSSMGGLPNIGLMAEHEKPVTFSTGPSNISGWGTSPMTSNLNTTPPSGFLQTPSTIVLNTPQPVDNQNFQLGKPPPGNKRGKR